MKFSSYLEECMNWIVRRHSAISAFLFVFSVLAPYILLVSMELNKFEAADFTNHSLLAAFFLAALNRRYGERIDIFRHKQFERRAWIDLASKSRSDDVRHSAFFYVITDLALTLTGGFIFSGFVFYVFLT